MEENKISSSVFDLKTDLGNLRRLTCFNWDKRAIRKLTYGFFFIVKAFEEKNDLANGEDAVTWLRLYMTTRALLILNKPIYKEFSKSVPVVITYLIGWLQHGPIDLTKFVKDIIKMTVELIQSMESDELKELEVHVKDLIPKLWDLIDEIGTFELKVQILKLMTLILKNLSNDLQYQTLTPMLREEPDKIKYVLLDLTKYFEDVGKFKKFSREILNLHNENLKNSASVFSYKCKNIYLGKDIKFIKPTFTEELWFDFNMKSQTISFDGRKNSIYQKYNNNINVTLKPKKIAIGSNNLIIQFEAPALTLDLQTDENGNLPQNIEFAYFENLTKAEIQRFRKASTENDWIYSLHDLKMDCNSENRLNNLSDKNNTPTKPESQNCSHTYRPLKTQEVKPFKASLDFAQKFKTAAKKETTNNPQVYDEYLDLDVSDAEPCQSYRIFKSRASNLLEKPTSSNKARKRTIHEVMDKSDLENIEICTLGASATKKKQVKDLFDILKDDEMQSTLKGKQMSIEREIHENQNSFQTKKKLYPKEVLKKEIKSTFDKLKDEENSNKINNLNLRTKLNFMHKQSKPNSFIDLSSDEDEDDHDYRSEAYNECKTNLKQKNNKLTINDATNDQQYADMEINVIDTSLKYQNEKHLIFKQHKVHSHNSETTLNLNSQQKYQETADFLIYQKRSDSEFSTDEDDEVPTLVQKQINLKTNSTTSTYLNSKLHQVATLSRQQPISNDLEQLRTPPSKNSTIPLTYNNCEEPLPSTSNHIIYKQRSDYDSSSSKNSSNRKFIKKIKRLSKNVTSRRSLNNKKKLNNDSESEKSSSSEYTEIFILANKSSRSRVKQMQTKFNSMVFEQKFPTEIALSLLPVNLASIMDQQS